MLLLSSPISCRYLEELKYFVYHAWHVTVLNECRKERLTWTQKGDVNKMRDFQENLKVANCVEVQSEHWNSLQISIEVDVTYMEKVDDADSAGP